MPECYPCPTAIGRSLKMGHIRKKLLREQSGTVQLKIRVSLFYEKEFRFEIENKAVAIDDGTRLPYIVLPFFVVILDNHKATQF